MITLGTLTLLLAIYTNYIVIYKYGGYYKLSKQKAAFALTWYLSTMIIAITLLILIGIYLP